MPLAWIKELARTYPVYAIGNPKLGVEAGIADKRAVKTQMARMKVEIVKVEPVDLSHLEGLPMICRQKLSPESILRNAEGKVAALWRLTALFPDDIEVMRIVVDDIDLHTMPGWVWVSPEGFVAEGLPFWVSPEGFVAEGLPFWLS